MAINYSKTSTYKDVYKNANRMWDDAKAYDSDVNRQRSYGTWQSVVSSIGGAIGGAEGGEAGRAIGTAGGWLLGSVIAGAGDALIGDSWNETFAWLNGGISRSGRRQGINTLITERDKFVTASKTTLSERNDVIRDLRANINLARNDYDMTYGKGSYDKIEQSVIGLLNLENTTALREVLSKMQEDKVANNIASRMLNYELGYNDDEGNPAMTGGNYTQEDINKFIESAISLSDLGNAYTNYLFDTYSNADTEFGDKAKALTTAQTQAIEDYEQSIGASNLDLSQQFASAFFNYREQNIAGEEQLGRAQAEQSSSGIRTTSRTATGSKMQKVRNDIARASYLSTLKYLTNRLTASYKNLETTRSRTFKAIEDNRILMRRQMSADVTNRINSIFRGYGQGANEAGGKEMSTDAYVATAYGYNQTISENNSYGKNKKYVDDDFNVETAFSATV